jgi:DNA-binding CsgD family transcriptional regulator
MPDHLATRGEQEGPPWVRGLADAVLALGTPYFWDALSKVIGSVLENQGIVVFRYSGQLEPTLMFSNFRNQVSRGDFREYRTRAYLLDPMYLAFQERRADGVHMLRELAADRFFFSEYYRTYYVQTGLSDELCLFCWINQDDLVMISVVRGKHMAPFASSGVRLLRKISALLSSMVYRHVNAGVAQVPQPPNSTSVPPTLTIGDDNLLTQRELAIANLILRGHSSPSMSLLLGISIETIKVHRRHIYQKLNISSQAELFSLAMNRISDSDLR